MRSGAEILIDGLQRHGVSVVAGMPGGANLPLYDALARSPIRHVLVRHEQAAGFIAQGLARVTGRAGVCFATSGPGATNLVTALADARMDSVPVVAITGQVPTALLGTDAFQEVDTVAMMRPVVKHASMVRSVADLAHAVDQAFAIAQAGRPGPVLLDVPKDIQQAMLESPAPRLPIDRDGASAAVPTDDARDLARSARDHAERHERLLQVAALLHAAQRPVIYAGGGVSLSGAHALLSALAHKQQIPVACTLMGLGCFDPDDALHLGMLGMHAAPFTNLVMREADLLLAIGARFDDRATGRLSEFCPAAKVVHIDIDGREIGKLRKPDIGIVADAGAALAELLPLVSSKERAPWRARVAALRDEHPLPIPRAGRGVHALLGLLAAQLTADIVVTTDVGQHQMWAAQRLPFRRPRQLLTSGGLGSMGFGLPAAIGAALATQGRVLCITGDASLLLNIHELATLGELDLDVTVLVLDNRHLGLVRQQQMLFYNERLSAARLAHATDFVALAGAFGVQGIALDCTSAPPAALGALLAQRGPRLIHARIDAGEMVLPMVAPGAGNHEMVGATCVKVAPSSHPLMHSRSRFHE